MARDRDPESGSRRAPDEPDAQIDLHGMPPEQALRRLAQELHACRMRREDRLLVITGRGFGNRTQQPVLRPRVEAWLAGADGIRHGVVGVETHSRGGALLVHLRTAGRARGESDRGHLTDDGRE